MDYFLLKTTHNCNRCLPSDYANHHHHHSTTSSNSNNVFMVSSSPIKLNNNFNQQRKITSNISLSTQYNKNSNHINPPPSSIEYNYYYSQQHKQPCIINYRSNSKSTLSKIPNTQKLQYLKPLKRDKVAPPPQNYLIKYPLDTNSFPPVPKSYNKIPQISNKQQDINVYDEIITSDQEEPKLYHHSHHKRSNLHNNDYELLSNLNSSLNSSSMSSSNRNSMICMNQNFHNKITSKINCFKSFGGTAKPAPPTLPPPKLKHESSPTSSSETFDSISSCSSISSSKSIYFPKQPLHKVTKSPVISSGYNSSQDQDFSYNKNYNSSILSYVGLASRDFLTPRQQNKIRSKNDDSGLSTMQKSNDYDHDNDSTNSNMSSFLSDLSNLESSSLSSVSNNSSGYYNDHQPDESYIKLSPFPRVKTCMIAQIKQLDSSKKPKNQLVQEPPIYENLNITNATTMSKQYSINDIMLSLKSLEFQNFESKRRVKKTRVQENEEDLLCDKEVQFYLSQVDDNSSLSEQHQYQFLDTIPDTRHRQPIIVKHNSVKPPKSFNTKILIKKINKPTALWEQLV